MKINTADIDAGTASEGQVVGISGGKPTWVTPAGSISITDGTTTETSVTDITFVGATVTTTSPGEATVTITGGGGGGGGSGTTTTIYTADAQTKLFDQLAILAATTPSNLNGGTSIDRVVDLGGHVAMLLYANTSHNGSAPAVGSTYTVPAGCVAVCVGGEADRQIYVNPSFYAHRLYNLTHGTVAMGFDGGSQNRSDGWFINAAGAVSTSIGGFPNNTSLPVVGVAGDVLQCQAWTSGDGNYRVQSGAYYLVIVEAATGKVVADTGAPGEYNPNNLNHPWASDYVLDSGGVTLGTMHDTPLGMSLLVKASGGGYNRGITALRTAPTAPFSFAAKLVAAGSGGGDFITGICISDSTGALVTFYRYTDGNIYVQKWNDKGSYSGNISSPFTNGYYLSDLWLAFGLDASGKMTVYMGDGVDWISGGTFTLASYLNGGPYKVGFHLATNGYSGSTALMRIPAGGIALGSEIPPSINGYGSMVQVSSGRDWDFHPPLAADFPSRQSGDSTAVSLVDDLDAGLLFDAGAPGTGDVYRGAFKTLPSGDFSVITRVHNRVYANGTTGIGITLSDSTSGKTIGIGIQSSPSGRSYELHKRQFPSGFSSNVFLAPDPSIGDGTWFKITRVGSTLAWYHSADGKLWNLAHSESATAYLSASPDRIGLGVYFSGTASPNTMSVSYWKQSW